MCIGDIMRKHKDVIGKKYGRLTVINEYKKGSKYICDCKCDCGNTVSVQKSNLLFGHTKSCGCLQKNDKYDNLIGKKFGKLTVVRELDIIDKNGHHNYLCHCDCGKYVEVLGVNLLYNQTTSCGCYRKVRQLCSKINSNNVSGVKGVYFDNRMNKWAAKLTINRKTYKSYFNNFNDAVRERQRLEEIYHKPVIENGQKKN